MCVRERERLRVIVCPQVRVSDCAGVRVRVSEKSNNSTVKKYQYKFLRLKVHSAIEQEIKRTVSSDHLPTATIIWGTRYRCTSKPLNQGSQTQIHQGATFGGKSLWGPHFEVKRAVRAAM